MVWATVSVRASDDTCSTMSLNFCSADSERAGSARSSIAKAILAHSDFDDEMLCNPAATSGGALSGNAVGSTASRASITPLPMPRAGSLATLLKLTSSCGLMISFR